MIIDSHVHLVAEGWITRASKHGWASRVAARTGVTEEEASRSLASSWDPTGDRLVAEMDDAGIEKAVILPIDYGLTPQGAELEVGVEEYNQCFARAASRHPGRLIPFLGVDPRRPDSIRLLETGVKEWGMSGLKLHPGTGFYPNDRAFYPLYAKAAELGVPVLTHTGPIYPPMYSKYAQAIHLDEVAADFPDLQIIAAHCGLGGWSETASLASVHSNMWVDLSAWQPRLNNPPEFYRVVRSILDTVGADRVLFGSDWPYLKGVIGQAGWVGVFRELPQTAAAAGVTFRQMEVDAILGGNAVRLLGV